MPWLAFLDSRLRGVGQVCLTNNAVTDLANNLPVDVTVVAGLAVCSGIAAVFALVGYADACARLDSNQ